MNLDGLKMMSKHPSCEGCMRRLVVAVPFLIDVAEKAEKAIPTVPDFHQSISWHEDMDELRDALSKLRDHLALVGIKVEEKP